VSEAVRLKREREQAKPVATNANMRMSEYCSVCGLPFEWIGPLSQAMELKTCTRCKSE
jgi:hypothetical protein